MSTKTIPASSATLTLLSDWVKAAKEVVDHIGGTRGLSAPYYHIREDSSPWPIEAANILNRHTSTVIGYIKSRHALDVCVPLERIRHAAGVWVTKRDSVLQFPQTRHVDSNAAVAAMHDLARFTEEGVPEQKRLDLDRGIADGAAWRAAFPLLAECFGEQRPFVIRRNMIHWAMWVQRAFSKAIRGWPVPDEKEILSRLSEKDPAWVGFFESPERWELAGVVSPRYIPNTDETPIKLAIQEARRVGDLAVALPVIKRLDDELQKFVSEALRWPQGNRQPSRTEHLLHAVIELEELTDNEKDGLLIPPPSPPKWTPRPGYVGRKTICIDERFKKKGKNPSATTIDYWVKKAKHCDAPIEMDRDPANRENYYPEAWIMERIGTWNPRISES